MRCPSLKNVKVETIPLMRDYSTTFPAPKQAVSRKNFRQPIATTDHRADHHSPGGNRSPPAIVTIASNTCGSIAEVKERTDRSQKPTLVAPCRLLNCPELPR